MRRTSLPPRARPWLPLVLVLVTPLAWGNDFTLSLTNDSARGYLRFSESNDPIATAVGYTYHSGSRHIADFDIHAQGRTAIGNLPMTVGLGLHNTYFRDSPIEGGATAPGAFARANIPDAPGLSFNAALYMSPSILSYGDAEGLRFTEVSVSYRLIRNAEVLVGYRYVGADLEQTRDEARLEEGLIGGMRLLF